MSLNYSAFYTKLANKTPDKLKSPRVFNISQFALPKSSIYHYLPMDSEDLGPADNLPLFDTIKAVIPLYTPLGLGEDFIRGVLGRPVYKTKNTLAMIKDWHRDHPRFRFFKEPHLIPFKQDVPVVVNHSMVAKKFFYNGAENRKNYYMHYNQWFLSLKALVQTNESMKTDYNNFIFMDVPEELTPVSTMRKALTGLMPNHYKTLGNMDSLLVFEIWKFCRAEEDNIFNDLSQNMLDKLHFVFTYNDVWSLIKMGDLAKWRADATNPNGSISPVLMSKQFMMFLIRLKQSATDKELVELTEEERLEIDQTDQQDFQKDDEDKDGLDNPQDVISPDDLEASEKEAEDSLSQMEEYYSSILDEEEEDEITVDKTVGQVDALEDSSQNLNLPVVGKTETSGKDKVKPIEQKPEFDLEDSQVEAGDALNLNGKGNSVRAIPMVVKRNQPRTPEEKAIQTLNRQAQLSNMPLNKYKALESRLGTYIELVLDKEDGRTLEVLADVKPEDIDIFKIDEEQAKISTLNVFDRAYTEQVLERDIVSMITHAQGGGLLVQKMAKDEINTMSGESLSYSVRVQPINGEASTLRFRIPKVDEDGAFEVKGKTYRLRKQRCDLPIRKIKPTEVALTSYFGKTFVKLHETRKFNYSKWLVREIRLAADNKEVLRVKKTYSQDVFDNLIRLPNVFQILAQSFKAIELDIGVLLLDYKNREKVFGEKWVKTMENLPSVGKGLYLMGKYNKSNQAVFMNEEGEMFVSGSYKDGEVIRDTSLNSLGYIEDVLGIDKGKQPASECTNVAIMGKLVPTGLVLGYYYGLKQLLANLKPAYYRTVPTGKQMRLLDHEYAIRFSDYSLILSRRDKLCSYIMGGFLRMADATVKYSIYDFDKQPVYSLMMEALKYPARYVKEIDLYINMFVDPITERVLIDMNEPTDFIGLIIRANEMLLTLDHPDQTDGNYQRIRGYERFAGEVWTQLVNSMRVHARHGDPSNYPVEMNPEAVWTRVNMDTATIIENKINPVQDLKQQEVTTYGGNGGRSSRSMVKDAREFNKTSVGLVSEGTVDSGEAGVTTYLSSNPKFKNLYGMRDLDDKGLDAENVFSTSAMMAPCSDKDDKRSCRL